MSRSTRFGLVFAPEVVEHLRTIERRHHKLIQTTIDRQLMFTPERETRNRKLLELGAPFGATWELRFGPSNRFRVFYEVDNSRQSVLILAIGIKERNKLFIGREEFGQ
jgi:mRNA-degrading endonuclease RelE of RelBE toxin-antitoxin system